MDSITNNPHLLQLVRVKALAGFVARGKDIASGETAMIEHHVAADLVAQGKAELVP